MAEPSNPKEVSEFMSIKEFATKVKISVSTVRRHMKGGIFSGLGWVDITGEGRFMAPRKSVDEFIENRRLETARKLTPRPLKNR